MEYGTFYVLFNPEKQKFFTVLGGLSNSINMTEHYATYEDAKKDAEKLENCEIRKARIILDDKKEEDIC